VTIFVVIFACLALFFVSFHVAAHCNPCLILLEECKQSQNIPKGACRVMHTETCVERMPNVLPNVSEIRSTDVKSDAQANVHKRIWETYLNVSCTFLLRGSYVSRFAGSLAIASITHHLCCFEGLSLTCFSLQLYAC
jgi:hypothetical protein